MLLDDLLQRGKWSTSEDPKFRFSKNRCELFSGRVGVTSFINVPCGHCLACRMNKANEWSNRALLEFELNGRRGVFVTLTYSNDHLPADNQPNKYEFQKFMKRLRKKLAMPIRFLACGEKGDRSGRAHYHVLLFGVTLDDLGSVSQLKKGLWRASLIEEVWPFGISSVGEISEGSCKYVARYGVKNLHQEGCWLLMSRRPGLGVRFVDRLPKGSTSFYLAGKRPLPKYFKHLLKEEATASEQFLLLNDQARLSIGCELLSQEYYSGLSIYAVHDLRDQLNKLTMIRSSTL